MSDQNILGVVDRALQLQDERKPTQERLLVKVAGEDFSTTRLYRPPLAEHPEPVPLPPKEPLPARLEFTTLGSLVAFVVAADTEFRSAHKGTEFLHIVSPTEVRLLSHVFGPNRQRVELTRATIDRPKPMPWEQFLGREEFNIRLQARFEDNESSDKARALNLVGNIVDDTSIGRADDGVTQRTTVRAGVTLVTAEAVDNPFLLAPFRTFAEVSQPTSPFILRIRKQDGIQAALFEADGGAWKLKAVESIKDWLDGELDGEVPVYG